MSGVDDDVDERHLVLPGVGLEVANVDEVGCQGGNVQHSRLVLSSQLHVGGIGCDDLL